jgi:hypothetical protein
MAILVQFLLRLSFGMAVGMAVTPSRLVSSGYYRNHLYVTLGLATLAALVASQFSTTVAILAAGAAVLSYVGSVYWLYEAKRVGVALLWLVAGCSLASAFVGERAATQTGVHPQTSQFPTVIDGERPASSQPLTTDATSGKATGYREATMPLRELSVVTSGLILGLTMAAMLLGHWYLNSPGMELAPLRNLLQLLGAIVVAQMLMSGVCLSGEMHSLGREPHGGWWMLLLLRWSFGLLGVLVLIIMAWQTLKIPNTQSATGILYVAVIGVFVGELTALLLSAESVYPL